MTENFPVKANVRRPKGIVGNVCSFLVESPIKCMQSTETTFAGISPVRIPRIASRLISIVNVVLTTKHFSY